jgi:methylated-DNA-[protein]-cysteine S-methyltransferase
MEAHKMELLRKQIVYWTSVNFEQWQFVLAATTEGLCYVGSFEQFKVWSSKSSLKNTHLEQNDEIMLPYTEQFAEYLKGDRTLFTIPVDFIGTAFQISIWNALLEIPFGETCSYSDIAERIQKPQAVRAVGTAIGANPVLIVVPCHRVIGKNNTLTGYRSGLEMKAKLLQLEGVAHNIEGNKKHG